MLKRKMRIDMAASIQSKFCIRSDTPRNPNKAVQRELIPKYRQYLCPIVLP